MIDLSAMSIAELEKVRAQIGELLRFKTRERHTELVGSVLDAIQALAEEFPCTTVRVSYECSECGIAEERDLFNTLRQLRPSDFCY